MFISRHTLKWTKTCRSSGDFPHAHTAHFLLNRHRGSRKKLGADPRLLSNKEKTLQADRLRPAYSLGSMTCLLGIEPSCFASTFRALPDYMVWYRNKRIKTKFGMSIMDRRRILGLVA